MSPAPFNTMTGGKKHRCSKKIDAAKHRVKHAIKWAV